METLEKEQLLFYEPPRVAVFTVQSESIICFSGDDMIPELWP